jgi:ABC-2 type transport system permease protein
MPARLAGGAAPTVEVLLSAAILVVTIVLVSRVAATVYARGVLHTGAKLRLRDVLRGG